MPKKPRRRRIIPLTPLEVARMIGYGGTVRLQEALHCSRKSLYDWKKFPAELVPAVEKLTGISRKKLRPDLWG